MIFVPVSAEHADNFDFHTGLTSPWSHVNGALYNSTESCFKNLTNRFSVTEQPSPFTAAVRSNFHIEVNKTYKLLYLEPTHLFNTTVDPVRCWLL